MTLIIAETILVVNLCDLLEGLAVGGELNSDLGNCRNSGSTVVVVDGSGNAVNVHDLAEIKGHKALFGGIVDAVPDLSVIFAAFDNTVGKVARITALLDVVGIALSECDVVLNERNCSVEFFSRLHNDLGGCIFGRSDRFCEIVCSIDLCKLCRGIIGISNSVGGIDCLVKLYCRAADLCESGESLCGFAVCGMAFAISLHSVFISGFELLICGIVLECFCRCVDCFLETCGFCFVFERRFLHEKNAVRNRS